MKRDAQFVICISNAGYAASLEIRKIYQILPDKIALKHGQIRVIDESCDDYLYPEEFFVPLNFPKPLSVQSVARMLNCRCQP